jgi:hypothetical protein
MPSRCQFRDRPSAPATRANRSLHKIGRSGPLRAAVVVNDLRAFNGRASQEQGSSKPIETFSKLGLFAKLETVLKSGVWIRGVLSNRENERFHDGILVSSDENAYTLSTSRTMKHFTQFPSGGHFRLVDPTPGKHGRDREEATAAHRLLGG